MSEKLFQLSTKGITELPHRISPVTRTQLRQLEQHQQAYLGVQFVATNYSTGKQHGGVMDALGLDENGSPVVIQHKRGVDENVVSQGLAVLEWATSNRRRVNTLVRKKLGEGAVINWNRPRLICIADAFTAEDTDPAQSADNIDLVRYRLYGSKHLTVERFGQQPGEQQVAPALVDPPNSKVQVPYTGVGLEPSPKQSAEVTLQQSRSEVQRLFRQVWDILITLGSDVRVATLEQCFAFRHIRNFACVVVYETTDQLRVYLPLDPTTVVLEDGFSRDVTALTHPGTGDLELVLRSGADLVRARPLLLRSYEQS